MRKDLVSSAILLVVAGFYYLAATGIPTSTLEDEVGPRGLPVVLAVLLAMVAIVIGTRALVTAPVNGEASKDAEAPWPRALGMWIIGAAYIPVADFLGYWLALLLLIGVVAVYEGMRFSWRTAIVALGGATFFWLLFDVLLGVRVPEARLFG
jgi:putative tricarboxylic transport membrane protein